MARVQRRPGVKHCPVTGRLLLDCDCGACDDLESGDEDGPEAA